MMRLLFVDSGPQIFAAIKPELTNLHPDWALEFAGSGEKALERLAQETVHVVVADAEIPEMAGAELLSRIAELHPDCMRILVSDHRNRQHRPQLAGPVHQYLAKPYPPEVLSEAIQRAIVLQDFLTDPKLKRLVSRIESLPIVPAVYDKILHEFKRQDPSVARLGKLIAQDLGLCAKLLLLVNSPYFGLPENVTNPAQAILYLGVETVRHLVLSVGILNSFEHQTQAVSFDQLWQHSWSTGVLAKNLVEMELADAYLADQAFLAGLVHDVGKLVLAAGLSEEYPKIMQHHREQRKPLWQAELEGFGATHAEVGACLLGLWGMPTPLVEAVARHHRPVAQPPARFSLTAAVHVANCLEQEQVRGSAHAGQSQLDLDYLTTLELEDRVGIWRHELGAPALREAV